MIIINFTSGLGNQMFQYFFGEAISLKYRQQKIKYLNSLLPPHQIKIWDIFNIDIDMIERDKVPIFNNLIKKNKFIFVNLIKLIIKFNFNKNFHILSDNDFKNKLNILDDNKYNYFFYGYWQNINYFFNNFENIKRNISFKKSLNLRRLDKNFREFDNFIGVHIRGGDYLKNKNKKIFFEVDSEYYLKNIDYLNQKLNDPLFIFFTDDINYLKKILPKIKVNHRFIRDLSDNRNDDFQYLSLCDHFIIPNSSFSLWASYLSDTNKNKITIMPDNWFNKSYANKYKTKDYFDITMHK